MGQLKLANPGRIHRLHKPALLGVSPCMMRADLAHIAARYMDERLDPEKQYCEGINREGLAATAGYRIGHYGDFVTPKLLLDLGRAWRDARGIEKRKVNGMSIWTPATRSDVEARDMSPYERRLAISQFLPAV